MIRKSSIADRPLPVARCSACGGEWFRTATYYAFFREETLRIWPTWPDLTGQATTSPMTVGICLCGLPLKPLIGAGRGGTGSREVSLFLEALAKGRTSILEKAAASMTLAQQQLVTPADLQALEERLQVLRREAGRLQRGKPGRGRYSKFPDRLPDSGVGGTLTRDRLVLALQEKGFDFRMAQKVVRTMLDCMIHCLRRGERIKVPEIIHQ